MSYNVVLLTRIACWYRARCYLLELPYQLMVLNTKADAYQTFKIPEEQLVEIGLVYEV